MKKMRNLHLWIGLICSIFILVQSITGLVMITSTSDEPPQMGQGFPGNRGAFQGGGAQGQAQGGQTQGTQNQDLAQGNTQQSGNQATARNGFRGMNRQQFGNREAFDGGNTGFMGFIKNLHQGRIGNTNVKFIGVIAAVAMIVLTITGIFLSIKTLRAQSVSRKKARNRAAESDDENSNPPTE